MTKAKWSSGSPALILNLITPGLGSGAIKWAVPIHHKRAQPFIIVRPRAQPWVDHIKEMLTRWTSVDGLDV
ncbi:MAG TPA: hypothetical protein PLP19_18425 [bacterium]|nr:hypothetical protein [bacterium]HPN45474.1 hypothetical protein [bacterium]